MPDLIDNFDRKEFKRLLEIILEDYTSTVEFSNKSGVNRTYVSKILNLKLDKPPSPEILNAMANDAVSYEQLMVACGYMKYSVVDPNSSPTKEKPPATPETINNDTVKFALFGDKDIDDDVLDEVKRFAKYIRDKHYDTD